MQSVDRITQITRFLSQSLFVSLIGLKNLYCIRYGNSIARDLLSPSLSGISIALVIHSLDLSGSLHVQSLNYYYEPEDVLGFT